MKEIKEKIKEIQKESEIEGMPEITPEMIQSARKVLEAEGMIFYKKGRFYIPTEKGWKLLMEIKPVKEEIIAWGSEKIVANDEKRIGITKSSETNSCTIGIKANKACIDLSTEIKDILKQAKKVEIFIEVKGVKDKIIAFGSPALRLRDSEKIIIRKDDFIDDATIAILANKSANELKEELIEKLKDSKNEIKIIIEVKG